MKKALIIGAAGFVGGYLIDHLQKDCGWSIVATKLKNESMEHNSIQIYDLDILDKDSITDLLEKERPDYIFHLAAQSSVALSWKNPALTVDINIKGSINVLDAIREVSDYNPRILLIGSGEEYGHIKENETPIKETNSLRPGNIYAATKVCQNMIGKIYADAYNMDIMMVRAFNHIGPKQSPQFVVSDFCKQVAEIEKDLREPVLYVGNLNARRDFTDVRDVVRAYGLIIQDGYKGAIYNVGYGSAFSIQEILKKILSLSNKDITVEIDPAKMRPIDIPIIEADISLIKSHLNWEPSISLEQTLKDTLNYWRINNI